MNYRFSIPLLLFVLALCYGCKKDEFIPTETEKKNETLLPDQTRIYVNTRDFFDYHFLSSHHPVLSRLSGSRSGIHPKIQDISNLIQSWDQARPFVDSLQLLIGYPAWDYGYAFDSAALIPFIRIEDNFVNSYLAGYQIEGEWRVRIYNSGFLDVYPDDTPIEDTRQALLGNLDKLNYDLFSIPYPNGQPRWRNCGENDVFEEYGWINETCTKHECQRGFQFFISAPAIYCGLPPTGGGSNNNNGEEPFPAGLPTDLNLNDGEYNNTGSSGSGGGSSGPPNGPGKGGDRLFGDLTAQLATEILYNRLIPELNLHESGPEIPWLASHPSYGDSLY